MGNQGRRKGRGGKSPSKGIGLPNSGSTMEGRDDKVDPVNESDDSSEETTEKSAQKKSDVDIILEHMNGMKKELTKKIDDSIRSYDFQVKKVEKDVEKCATEYKQISSKINAVDDVTSCLRSQVKVQSYRSDAIEIKMEMLERESRKSTLIIEGVVEDIAGSIMELIAALFADLNVQFGTEVRDKVFRRGRRQGSDRAQNGVNTQNQVRPRPIVVVLARQLEKGEIFKHLRNLKGNEKWARVFFRDDLTEQQTAEQRDLRALAALARELGKHAIVKAGVLHIDDRTIRYTELYKLPPGLSLCKAKTLHILDDSAIIFQSKHSPLSNFFPCNIQYNAKFFLSVEAAFQYDRAMSSKCEHLAESIELCRDAEQVKRISYSIVSSHEWDLKCEEVMKDLLTEKFTRNRGCRAFLINTGERSLLEGTGDRKWGCGIPISRFKEVTINYPGQNKLGKILEEVREMIKVK